MVYFLDIIDVLLSYIAVSKITNYLNKKKIKSLYIFFQSVIIVIFFSYHALMTIVSV